MSGKPWYTNGLIDLQIGPNEVVPQGFSRGLKPRSVESINKQRETMKGHAGYWTGKKMHPDSRGETIHQLFADGQRVQWNKGLTKDSHPSLKKMAQNKMGKPAWNKGLKVPLSESSCEQMKLKQYNTKKRNNSFNISKPENDLYLKLCEQYGCDNVVRQYKDDRYPFACDFYIPSQYLFIELNKNWTHRGHPFNPQNQDDIDKLSLWTEKSQTSKFYANAIYQWTELDVRKRTVAEKNKLNYITIY